MDFILENMAMGERVEANAHYLNGVTLIVMTFHRRDGKRPDDELIFEGRQNSNRFRT